MHNLIIIPARGGSKRIKMKNLKLFCGVPMLRRCMAVAKELENTTIVVSSDNSDILREASSDDSIIALKRPQHLSDDITPTRPVIQHAITELSHEIDQNTNIICLYPTTPLLTSSDLAGAISLFENSNMRGFCISAVAYDKPVFRSFKINNKGNVEMLFPEHYNTRSQDLDKVFYDGGQFYIATEEIWHSEKRYFDCDTKIYEFKQDKIIDIDNQSDWEKAEALWKAKYEAIPNCQG